MIRALKNSGLGQLFLGTIVVAIMLAFILTGAGGTSTGGDDECVAEIGKHVCIEPKEFDSAFRLLSAIGGGSINEAAAKRLRLREQVARGLVEREVLVKQAEKMKLGTSEDDIDAELLEGRTRVSLPAKGGEQLAMSLAMCVNGPTGCEPGTIGLRAIDVKRDGKFDIELYKRTVRIWARRSPAQFKEMQAREYTAERLRQLISSQVRVSEEEAFLAFSRVRSKATARSVYVQKDWFERYVIQLDDAEAAAYQAAHEDAIKAGVAALGDGFKVGCPVVSEIRIDSAQPGSEEATTAQARAEDLLKQLKAKKDFASLARLHSQADSARFGGRAGCLDAGYGAGSAVLMEAAHALKKPGELSPVIETIRGFTILRLDDVVTEANRDALLKAHVAYKLALEQKADERARAFATELIERGKTQPLDAATTALNLETLGLTAQSKADEPSGHPALRDAHAPQVAISRPVSMDQDVVDEVKAEEGATLALFDLDKDDAIKDKPLAAENGYVVLQLKSKELLTKEKFEEDRARIVEMLWKRKAEQTLSDYVDGLIKSAGGITFNRKFIPKDEEGSTEKKS